MPPVDQWREDVLTLVSSVVDPLGLLFVLAAFTLGLISVRAVVA